MAQRMRIKGRKISNRNQRQIPNQIQIFLEPTIVETADEEDETRDAADSGEPDKEETLPPGQEAHENDFDELQDLLNKLDMEEEEDNFEFVRTVDHDFHRGHLSLKVLKSCSECQRRDYCY